ncbi:hypothetical protein LOTGIDRAFT_170520 [Lottia gigantea]|uniref:TNFR-Cys domain-containing protein n=1 Tax=Lottia gigantea TaxID=225164 RepID=V4BFN2_LOTGI|nr:hypothetical protein LOTGIDRAFT_170520 [Lottia gigantea]ESP04682.1 hypothetical protein LOTGIDRAFT_170520 [Lottia gigantea]
MNWCFNLTFFVFLCVYQTSGAEENICQDGQYYEKESNICRNCTKCPINLIIRTDCTNLSDTICSHFTEFDNFRNEIPYGTQEEITVVEESPDIPDIFDRDYNPRIIEEVPTTSSEDKYWKNLAFALIGVLCVLIIAATMVVWYACRKLHASVQIKRPEYDDTDDPDNGYVVIRSIRHTAPPSNQPLSQSRINNTNYQLLQQQQRLIRPYRPKRRLLNEYADDVFESDDSGGSRASRRILCSIPEQNDESTSPRESESSPEKQPMV